MNGLTQTPDRGTFITDWGIVLLSTLKKADLPPSDIGENVTEKEIDRPGFRVIGYMLLSDKENSEAFEPSLSISFIVASIEPEFVIIKI